MSQQILHNLEEGIDIRNKINDNFSELYSKDSVLVVKTSGEILGGHRIVCSKDGVVMYADAGDIATANNVIGLTTHAAIENVDIEIMLEGYITESGWSLVAGQPIFVGNNGQITQVAQSSPGYSLIIGFAENSNTIFIEKKTPIIL